MKSLILGTANFGGTYGISSQNKIANESIEQILSVAQENGINHFDTAKSYGDAEIILGKFLNKSQPLFIDSKIAKYQLDIKIHLETEIKFQKEIADLNKLVN